MQIMEKYKNIELIWIEKDKYCVRKKTFFGLRFFDLTTNGTDLTLGFLSAHCTIGSLDRATYVFNCNKIAMGWGNE